MDRIEFYWKPWKLLGLMIAPLACLLFGLDTLFGGRRALGSEIFGALATVIGLGLLLVYLWQVCRWGQRIVLDDEGIFDRSIGTPKILWGSILGMKIVPFQWTRLIALQLVDEEERHAALPWWKKGRGFGYGSFNINPLATGVSAEELMTMMVERIKRSRSSELDRT